MIEMKSKTAKLTPKFVLLVPCFVVLAACSSKQIQNASTEPLDIPADSSFQTPEPEYTAPVAPARVNNIKKSKKSGKVRKHKTAQVSKTKKSLNRTLPAVTGQVNSNQNTPPPEALPIIGDDTMASAPIAVPPMAPPVPFDMGMQDQEGQPNWILAALMIAGLVGLTGVVFRVRKHQSSRKRRLVYNA